jgi:hypothetical protein
MDRKLKGTNVPVATMVQWLELSVIFAVVKGLVQCPEALCTSRTEWPGR